MSSDAQLARERSSSIVTALRNRANGSKKFQNFPDPFLLYAEKCAAMMCTDNRKVELPSRTRTTFMTAFSPDHSLIASCHGDHNVHVTNIHTEKLVKSLEGHERSPWCISFHPSSSDILATGCLNGEVRVWDLRGGGSESWLAPAENTTIASLSFHPTDQCLLIAAGCWIYFWDWGLPKPFTSIKTSSMHEKVRLVRFNASGSHILTGVVNNDDQLSGGEEDEENYPDDWGLHSYRNFSAPAVNTSRRRRNFRDFLSSLSSTPMTVRSAAARPMTASYNLRSRRDSRPPPGDSSLDQSAASNESDLTSFPNATLPERAHHSSGYYPEFPPPHASSAIDLTSSYARDHERILHARVNVNAEIQHQYNRLQVLRLERRRLELRLQQLRERRSGASNADTSPAAEHSYLRTFASALRQTSPPRPSSPRRFTGALRRRLADCRTRRREPMTMMLMPMPNRPLHLSNADSPATSSAEYDSVPAMQPLATGAHSLAANTAGASNPQGSSAPSATGGFDNDFVEPNLWNVAFPSFVDLYRSALNPGTSLFRQFERAEFPAPNRGDSPDVVEPPLSRASPQARYRALFQWRRNQRRPRNINNYLGIFPGYSVPDSTSYRLQWWNFSRLEMPEISRSDINVIVPQCKIYNDSSVDISKDGRKLAAFIPSDTGFQESMQVCVYSLEPSTLGQVIFRKHIGQNAVCLSFSPLAVYVAVGVKNRPELRHSNRNAGNNLAQILKITSKTSGDHNSVVHHLSHPVLSDTPHRYVNINTIAWLPSVGAGILYGTNNGELRICRTQANNQLLA